MQTVNQKEKHARRPFGRSAFSLIELVIALTIGLGLVGLIAAWGAGAMRAQKVRAVRSAMANALAMADQLKQNSLFLPDHRLANFYWVQPHTAASGAVPTWGGAANARSMSSGEFFVYLASQSADTRNALESLGTSQLKGTPVPPAWALTAANQPDGVDAVLVDVFVQNFPQTDVRYKPFFPTSDISSPGPSVYSLVSPSPGYRLRSMVDPWGHELLYRYYTHKVYLNGEDPTDMSGGSVQSYTQAERILQDEAVAVAGNMGTPPPNSGARPPSPAWIAAYDHPHFASAGPDGRWGAFTAADAAGLVRDALAEKTSARNQEAQDNIYSMEEGGR